MSSRTSDKKTDRKNGTSRSCTRSSPVRNHPTRCHPWISADRERQAFRTRVSASTSPSWPTFLKMSSRWVQVSASVIGVRPHTCVAVGKTQGGRTRGLCRWPTPRTPALGRGDGGGHPDRRRPPPNVGRVHCGRGWRRRRHGGRGRRRTTRGATPLCRGVPTTRRGQRLGTVDDVFVVNTSQLHRTCRFRVFLVGTLLAVYIVAVYYAHIHPHTIARSPLHPCRHFRLPPRLRPCRAQTPPRAHWVAVPPMRSRRLQASFC